MDTKVNKSSEVFLQVFEQNFPLGVRNTPTGGAFRNYVLYGFPVGGFLTSVLENNLEMAAIQADKNNLIHLGALGSFLGKYGDKRYYGSKKKVEDWQSMGGLSVSPPTPQERYLDGEA
tara:strand:+ start:157 stop:510 length:354 start_codon:yes stop_codon:yes gene_type:complete